MVGSTVAAKEEREMELLLSEIPEVTAQHGQPGVGGLDGGGGGGAAAAEDYPQCYGVHCAARYRGYSAPRYGEDPYCPVVINRRDDGVHQGGGGAFHVPLSGGFLPSLALSRFTGSASSPASNPFVGRAPSPMVQAVDDAERLANQLNGLLVGDAAAAHAHAALMPQVSPAPTVKSVSLADVSAAHSAYYNFGAPGFSVHREPVLADQAMTAGYVSRSQCFAVDVGLDGYSSFPTSLDTSVGSFMYPRTRNGSGVGWGQGSVHPDHARPILLSGQSGAEHNWGYTSTGQIALYARGRNGGLPKSPYRGEDNLIVDEKNMPYLNRGKESRFRQHVNNRTVQPESTRMLRLRYENMVEVKGYIYFMAKDQNGCLVLQQKLEEGKHRVDEIFEGIIDHIAELMANAFANYLVQKLLDVCDEEQRLRIIAVLTEDPVRLVTVSLNAHGTRAIQKLIETIKIRKHIVLIISALQPSFIHLVNDPNGNHVINKCLTNFGAEENKAKIIVEICTHGFHLAQDRFGNYAVQYVLDLKIPAVNAHLASSQFEGSYVYLSKQKVGSNVVEKCLEVFPDDGKAAIILELTSASHFEQLLQDPFANYVIYTALVQTRGHLRNTLVESIRPHEKAIRTNPWCKRICKALSRR
ncbi:hypothetical protein GUJ93_ZPchr0006g44375 [Zizania palustris]|uniref:PUM-HD domain-containing protein n=1 Tax=Zizania palustris TaxID=103762 RepID=A0A8J5SJI3_ZIZPA|nr:hypothetical protein GUJ93_ZPchr0006g44375 [Zizania palustris]